MKKNLWRVLCMGALILASCTSDTDEEPGPLVISYKMEGGVGQAIPANPNMTRILTSGNIRYFLNQTVDNYYEAQEIRLDSIKYYFRSTFGDTYEGARLENTTLEINGVEVQRVPDINILQEATNQTRFKVDNPEAFDDLATVFLQESTINAYFRGEVVADNQSVIFYTYLDIYFTVTF